MTFQQRIDDFINKAQTKIRSLGNDLIEEFDPNGYQSTDSELLLMKIKETRRFINLLQTNDRGEMTDAVAEDVIDFFWGWLDLTPVVFVNYTQYQMPIEGTVVIVPSNFYALESALAAETAARIASDLALEARLCECITRVTVSTAAGTIPLNMLSKKIVHMIGSAPIAAPKTWQVSNNSQGMQLVFKFILSGLHIQTMPVDFTMTDARKVPGSSPMQWQPEATGKYQAVATYDGTEWFIEFSEPIP